MTLHLAVALDGTGWHPASWREPGARADELFTAGFWVDQVREAEAGLLDLVTFEDAFAAPRQRARRPRPGTPRRACSPRCASGPSPRRIGLVPTVIATHTEPFHVSTADRDAGLGHLRAGRRADQGVVATRPSTRCSAAARPTRRAASRLFDEAADHVEVQRRLWDSWEDDAEIRDAATGRFIDREKLHYIDFEGAHFSVRGPSITPRPPQGQPLVTALAHVDTAYRLAARGADLVFVTPGGVGRDGPTGDAEAILARGPGAEARRRTRRRPAARARRPARRPRRQRRRRPRAPAPPRRHRRRRSCAATPASSPAPPPTSPTSSRRGRTRASTGARLRPAVTAHDLPRITRELVPELQRRGLHRTAYEADTLRGRFGLEHPADRYATA